MSLKPDDLPSDLASVQAALLIEREALQAEREARLRAEVERDATAAKVTRIQAEAINWQAEAANARAELSDNEALIAPADREAQTRTVRTALRAHGASDRAAGVGT